MLSRAQRLGPSHFVVFVPTGKTWEVVQACCNKREFLYLSLQRLNTANHITTAGKEDYLSPVPKAGPQPPLVAGAAQWLPANKLGKARGVLCLERSNPVLLQRAQPPCWG